MNAIEQRKLADKERGRLRQLDIDFPQSPSRLYLWTIEQEELNNMARGRPPKKTPDQTKAANLLRAVEFITVATESAENEWAQFIRLSDKMAVAFNGQLAAGFPIEEELTLCPHANRMKVALSKCGASLLITETPANRLSIKGEKLNALVECELPENIPECIPDPNMYAVADGEKLKEAFKVCGVLASESAVANVMFASILLEPYVCTGTNGKAMVQFAHGLNLPPNNVLPKLFCATVAKVVAAIVGFGCTMNEEGNKVKSFTLWFDGGFWLKTICYADDWQQLSLFEGQTFPIDLPAGFFDAVDIISNFSDDGFVTFTDGKVQSEVSAEVGAQYDLPGLPGGKQFPGKMLKQLAPGMKTIDLTTYPDRAFFYGDNMRGVCMAIINR